MDARKEHDRAAANHHEKCCPKVGLFQHQRRGDHDDHHGYKDPKRVGFAVQWQPVVIGSEEHHDGDLCQFRRLKHHKAEVDPALGPHADFAE